MIEWECAQLAGPASGMAVPQDVVHAWLARELHDSVVQPLTTLLVEMELLKRDCAPGEGRLRDRIDRFETITRAALANLRQTTSALRAEPIRHNGFRPWLTRLAADLGSQGDIVVRVRTRHWPQELSAHASYNLCRIVEEALRNIIRHSRASHVSINLAGSGPHLHLAIRDNGIGWSPLVGACEPGHGIRGMGERALVLGGDLRVTAAPGRGTTVRLRVPRERAT